VFRLSSTTTATATATAAAATAAATTTAATATTTTTVFQAKSIDESQSWTGYGSQWRKDLVVNRWVLSCNARKRKMKGHLWGDAA